MIFDVQRTLGKTSWSWKTRSIMLSEVIKKKSENTIQVPRNHFVFIFKFVSSVIKIYYSQIAKRKSLLTH